MRKQQGNAVTIVAIVILAVAILGLLGYVFWNHFMSKPATKTTDAATTQTQTDANTSQLSQTATLAYNGTSMSINYPSTWLFDDEHGDGSFGSILSPDSKLLVALNLTPPDGIGGTCSGFDTNDPITDPIVEADWSAMPHVPQAIFSSHISHYLPDASSGSASDTYTYEFGAVESRDEIKNVKAGDSSCAPYAFAEFIDLKATSGAMLQASVDFADLDSTGFGKQKSTNTQSQIENQFQSTNAATAESIIKSISLK